MNFKRYLFGKLEFHYAKWQSWNCIGFDRYWSGRLIYINFSKFYIVLDCRKNWLEDMVTGNPR